MPRLASPEIITAPITRIATFCSYAAASSSIAKATPASGVLKAAATPAAPPAIITPAVIGTRNSRCTQTMTAALVCTVGPSRPAAPPTASTPTVIASLAAAVRSDTSGPIFGAAG